MVLAEKLGAILPRLNEQQRRLVLAAEARALGRGGITRLARVTGISRPTITKALRELTQPPPTAARVRQVGGGRKPRRERDATLLTTLEALVEPETRGDPMSPLRWTCKSLRQLAAALRGATRLATAWSATCCGRRATGCRRTPRRARAVRIRIGTPSSAT